MTYICRQKYLRLRLGGTGVGALFYPMVSVIAVGGDDWSPMELYPGGASPRGARYREASALRERGLV